MMSLQPPTSILVRLAAIAFATLRITASATVSVGTAGQESLTTTATERYTASKLLPQSALSSNCFNFPEQNFDRANSIRGVYGRSPFLIIGVGDRAIDFTVHDTDGNPWNLREALETGGGKPVVLIWGMYTCPAFQGMGTTPPWEKCGYRDEYDLVEHNKDRATFVHLYVAEPHPAVPGTNFDSGKVIPNYWSTVPQHGSYEDRLAMAARIQDNTHASQVLLPEYLPGNPYSDLIQPVWCSYALGARSAVVISPAGEVVYQQEWLQTHKLGGALDVFWSRSAAKEAIGKGEEGTGIVAGDGDERESFLLEEYAVMNQKRDMGGVLGKGEGEG